MFPDVRSMFPVWVFLRQCIRAFLDLHKGTKWLQMSTNVDQCPQMFLILQFSYGSIFHSSLSGVFFPVPRRLSLGNTEPLNSREIHQSI